MMMIKTYSFKFWNVFWLFVMNCFSGRRKQKAWQNVWRWITIIKREIWRDTRKGNEIYCIIHVHVCYHTVSQGIRNSLESIIITGLLDNKTSIETTVEFLTRSSPGLVPFPTAWKGLKVAEHSFSTRSCWCNLACAQGFQKTNMPSTERSISLYLCYFSL